MQILRVGTTILGEQVFVGGRR